MNTETTEHRKGQVFYDADCAICQAWARRFEETLARRAFKLVALQSPGVGAELGVGGEELLREMRVRLANGHVIGGADAMMELAGRIWWAWPLWLISRAPGMMSIMRMGYRRFAARRHCDTDACRMKGRGGKLADFLPLFLLTATALCFRNGLSGWAFMCLLVGAIIFGFKWVTWIRAFRSGRKMGIVRTLIYWVVWPGMDQEEFFFGKAPTRPGIGSWVHAVIKKLLGALLIWAMAIDVVAIPPLGRGWIGLFGFALFFHFGIYHLMALPLQAVGIRATPLMDSPLMARSLADFWGNRWNTAFHVLADKLIFRPLTRWVGIAAATMGVFFISGLVHDLLLSLPARGGYGWPTAYFVLQGAGVLFERSKTGRALGLGHGIVGRLFMFTVLLAPICVLFHPPFIRNVILPMLDAIGSI